MFKMIGGDGREYGPVTSEQLRKWINEGRVNGQTRVQVEGSAEWKNLAEVPEFIADFSGTPHPATPPMPPPISSAVAFIDGDAFAAQVLARDYKIDIGRFIGNGWEMVKANFWLLVGAGFVSMAIISGCGICAGPMLGGLFALILKLIRKQPAQFGDAFLGFNFFLPLMLAHIVCGLLIILGGWLLILPGIYLAVSWSFTIPLVMDKKMDFWPAMELSRKAVGKHWWSVCGLMIVNGCVGMLGVLGCVVGIFITMPIAMVSLMYAYEEIFGDRPAMTV